MLSLGSWRNFGPLVTPLTPNRIFGVEGRLMSVMALAKIGGCSQASRISQLYVLTRANALHEGKSRDITGFLL